MSAPRPYNLVAELTYRCPLRCAYCSNPLSFRDTREALHGAAWGQVLRDAAELGVVHVGLTGGEPTLHPNLAEIVAAASEAEIYTHLVTAGTTLDLPGLRTLRDAGLRSVQLSVQDSRPAESDRIAGVESFARKLEFARDVRALDLPLSLNVVIHRHNLSRVPELIDLARELGAHRLELANAQYHGWALLNREQLLPTQAQIDSAARAVEAARRQHPEPEIIFVFPDYHRGRPKPCMGGWGRRVAVVAPDGRVLPCHSAAELPGLEFWSVADRPFRACWEDAPGMNLYRGQDWMPEPCRSCPERERDFGGCRCQAFALTGDAGATDPACDLAASHDLILAARRAAEQAEGSPLQLRYRG